MAHNDNNNANGKTAISSNGTTKALFEMPSSRSRTNYLQPNTIGVGRRLISGPEQYVTPPARSVCSFFFSVQIMCFYSLSVGIV